MGGVRKVTEDIIIKRSEETECHRRSVESLLNIQAPASIIKDMEKVRIREYDVLRCPGGSVS